MDDDWWLSQDREGTDSSLSHPFISHCNPNDSLCIHHCLLLAFPFVPYKMAASIYVLPLSESNSIVLHYTISFNKPSEFLKFSQWLFH